MTLEELEQRQAHLKRAIEDIWYSDAHGMVRKLGKLEAEYRQVTSEILRIKQGDKE